jgi:LysR family transcriptional regulator, transcriptional activator for dmlA
MPTWSIQPQDLELIIALAREGSIARAAGALNVSGAAVSKQLASLELRLGVPLATRTTRRLSLTDEGELFLEQAQRTHAELAALKERLSSRKETPRGLLRVGATLGFGRRYLGPLISSFARKYPGVTVQLHLSEAVQSLAQTGFDVVIRLGEPQDGYFVATRIAQNRHVLVASPKLLKTHAVPTKPADCAKLPAIVIRENEAPFDVWTFRKGQQVHHVKVRSVMACNHGEVALAWALDGHGMLMRSEWDVAEHLRTKRLRELLPDWNTVDSDFYALYTREAAQISRVRVFVEHLKDALAGPPWRN